MILRTFAFILALAAALPAYAIDNDFSYQGSLEDGGLPANGSYDFYFEPYTDFGTSVHAPVILEDVVVTDGVFTVRLNFGNAVFDGEPLVLLIGVRAGASSGAFTYLTPETPIRATPYALRATNASFAGYADFAGGVLANSIDSPAIVDGSVGQADVNTSQIQRRIANGCLIGTAVRQVAVDGSVTCEAVGTGDITSVAAGTGLTGGGTSGAVTISADTSVLQNRVTGNCAVGSSIRAIAANGTVTCEASSATNWALTGNSGINPATQFVGTTNNAALELRANNLRVARFEPPTGVGHTIVMGHPSNSVPANVNSAIILGGGNAGFPNVVTDNGGLIVGGVNQQAGNGTASLTDAGSATVVGGYTNSAQGAGAAVFGGSDNVALGNYAMIGGGNQNCAGAPYSWAGGRRAKVRPGASPTGTLVDACQTLSSYPGGNGDTGSFVWADDQVADFLSTGPNQFAIRASGGLRWAGTGVNSTTSPAFTHQVNHASNTCTGGSGVLNSRTAINHPLLNNNPNAVIVITPNYGSTAGGVAPPRNPLGVYYNAGVDGNCAEGRWVIYDLTTGPEAMNNGAKFNIWFVLP